MADVRSRRVIHARFWLPIYSHGGRVLACFDPLLGLIDFLRGLIWCPNQTFVVALTDLREHPPTITARYVALIGDENAGCAPAFLQQERDRACKSVAVSNRQNHLKIGS
jgi:hypothetical protein